MEEIYIYINISKIVINQIQFKVFFSRDTIQIFSPVGDDWKSEGRALLRSKLNPELKELHKLRYRVEFNIEPIAVIKRY